MLQDLRCYNWIDETLVGGLTGQTGSGKTTVADILKKNGCLIIDADLIAREIVEPGHKCLLELKKEFGDIICNKDGTLNRRILASIAFSNKEKTNKLNNITHPFIVSKINEIIKDNDNKCRIKIIDAALLIESGLNKICKIVISIIAPENIRIKRIIKRDFITKEEAIKRVKSQNNEEYYRSNSSYVLDGTQDKYIIYEKVKEILDKVRA